MIRKLTDENGNVIYENVITGKESGVAAQVATYAMRRHRRQRQGRLNNNRKSSNYRLKQITPDGKTIVHIPFASLQAKKTLLRVRYGII